MTEQELSAEHIRELHEEQGRAIHREDWEMVLEISGTIALVVKKQADDAAWPNKVTRYGKR